jgi:peptidoglycan/LPS O-acetylase OafA/YrhL
MAVQRRIEALDSLRGLAALIVVFHHVWLLGFWRPEAPWTWRLLRYTPLNLLVAGRAPVILFFVLSGFALASALDADPAAPSFLLRRFCRIWLPFAAAVLCSAAGEALLGGAHRDLFSAWFAELWQSGPGSVTGVLLMPGAPRADLDPVVWSLVHELRISLAFPLLLLLARRRLILTLAITVALHVTSLGLLLGKAGDCPEILTCKPLWASSVGQSFVETAYFLVFFVLGIALRLRRQAAVAAPPWLLGAAALLLLLAVDLLSGIGGAALIVLAQAPRGLAGMLQRAAFLWLGRVSYSLYLVHVPVMLILAHGLGGIAPRGLIVAAIVPASLIAAAWFYRAVELPSQQLGRTVAGMTLAPRPTVRWRRLRPAPISSAGP